MSGFISTFGKIDPLHAVNSRIDPLANSVGIYGKNAPTPIDPLGLKAGFYGYDIKTQQAATAATPAPQSTSGLLTAGPDDAATDVTRRQAAAAQQGSTSKTLFGQ